MKKIDDTEDVMSSNKEEYYIDGMGNVSSVRGSNKVCLAVEELDENCEVVLRKLSKDYYYMEPIYDDGVEDHYIVCDVKSSQFLEYEEDFDSSKLSFKYGIVALQRDEQGNIIPMAEKVVVPILYDEISENNMRTVTAQENGLLTYIDINPESKNYGKQLVPLILAHAVPFSTEYEDFAECSVGDVVGYLPRDCKPRTILSELDLLTEEQVQYLLTNSEVENRALYESSVNKYSKLTGKTYSLKFTKNN